VPVRFVVLCHYLPLANDISGYGNLIMSVNMRIGFDAKRCFGNNTGLGNYSRTLLKSLGALYPENEYHLYTPYIRKTTETNFTGDPCFHIHLPGTFFTSWWRSYAVTNRFKKDEINLYHGLSNEIPVNSGMKAIKSVVTVHDLIFKIYPGTYNYVDKYIYDLKFRYSCNHAGKIIAISENTKKDILEYYNISPDKIEVIYQACNPLFYNLNSPEENAVVLNKYNIPKEYLLYVGSIEPRKNLKTLIKSYQYLRSGLKIPLVLIGKGGTYKKEIEKLINKTGIEKLVTWIDNLSNNEHLHSIYQSSSAFIYPSFYEGFGLPVAEALLSRTPVITSVTSSLPEAGGPGSLYFNPSNPEQLAENIEKVLTDSLLRQQMSDNGFDYAMKNFSADVVTKKMIGFYENVLSNPQ